MEFTEKCNTGDPKEKQFWPVIWGTLSKCIHHGPSQTWRKAVHWLKGSGDSPPRDKGILKQTELYLWTLFIVI